MSNINKKLFYLASVVLISSGIIYIIYTIYGYNECTSYGVPCSFHFENRFMELFFSGASILTGISLIFIINNTPSSVNQPTHSSLPKTFDLNSFLYDSCEHFYTFHNALNIRDYSLISQYVHEDLLSELKAKIADDYNTKKEFRCIKAELGQTDTTSSLWKISVIFKGTSLELGQEKMINHTWHLERDMTQDNSPWEITKIEHNAPS